MKKRTLPTLLALLLPIAGCQSTPQPTTQTPATAPATQSRAVTQSRTAETALPQPTGPQNFDFYLLNLSWSPEFCFSHRSAPECGNHAAFVLHGIWPQNLDGTFPQHCSNAPGPADASQFADIYPDQGLLEHEWQTHGTCSGLSPDDFFTTARAAFKSVAIPTQLTQLTQQISMPPAEILNLFNQTNPNIPDSSLALSCGNNFLTAVEVCLDKQLHPIPCGTIRSCRANTVRIPPP